MSFAASLVNAPDPWLEIDIFAKNGDEHLISCDFGDGAPAVFLAHYELHPKGFNWRFGDSGIKDAYVNGYLPVPLARGYRA